MQNPKASVFFQQPARRQSLSGDHCLHNHDMSRDAHVQGGVLSICEFTDAVVQHPIPGDDNRLVAGH